MLFLLIVVIGLVVWSLRLMRAAFNHREFSLMLAGTLVAISAAGVIVVYFLMEGYMGYMTKAVRYQIPLDNSPGVLESVLSGVDGDRFSGDIRFSTAGYYSQPVSAPNISSPPDQS